MCRTRACPDAAVMDQQSVAEILPGLYRAVLDAVSDLEARGLRREAARIRSEATDTYSRAWNHGAARRLQILRDRAARIADGKRRNGSRGLLGGAERKTGMGRGAV